MYLVLDIETVPDTSVWTPPVKTVLPPKLKKEKTKPTKADEAFFDLALKHVAERKPIHPDDCRKAAEIADMKENGEAVAQQFLSMIPPEAPEADPFPPVYAHRPIAIGFMQLDDSFAVKAFGCAGTLTHGDDEKRLLHDFGTFAGSHGHTLVGWNSKGFDLPVLMMRSMRHGVSQAWFGKDHRYRYDENRHMDLKLLMTDYGGVSGAKGDYGLSAVSRVVGLPGKVGTDGSMVAEMYAQQKHQEIAAYCLGDVLETALVFLRLMLLRGRMPEELYKTSAHAMVEYAQVHTAIPQALFQGIDPYALFLEPRVVTETSEP